MPPFLPRKRSSSPSSSSRLPQSKKAKLADALDAEATNDVGKVGKAIFSVDSDSGSDSSLSDVDSEQFEDVVTDLRNESYDEDENIEWEDATPADAPNQPQRIALADGPIQLHFRKDDETIDYSAMSSAAKKGPSRREKQARIDTHKMHVQFLLWHNAIRNSWISDTKVQQTLLKQLPQQITHEVQKWKRASGLSKEEPEKVRKKSRSSSVKSKKSKHTRNQRDWGNPSQRLEAGKPDMSHGDPLISLMKVLAAYWKKRFAIVTPGLRKRGYSTKQQLKRDIHSYKHDEHDPERHGERIKDLEEFRQVARTCQGSRDVGAQLFTALIRALGIEARLVASLQPSGYGWTKAEQYLPGKASAAVEKSETTSKRQAKQQKGGTRPTTIILDTDNEDDESQSTEDDGSVVDVTISMPKQKKAQYDRDLAFPIYWTEAISPITHKVLPVSPLVLENSVASTTEVLSTFEPRGSKAEKTHQVIAYVVAHSSDGTAKDVTVRYLRKSLWPGKTKGFRYPVEKVPVYDKTGRIKRYESYDWFKHIMSLYGRSTHLRTATDDIEDTTDLVPAQPEMKTSSGVDTLQSLKASQDFVLERFLRREEALKPDAKPDRIFSSGKGENTKEEPVYLRADVERCLTAESWHKEGRRPKLGETPMKLVPVRAVTLTRKREAEEHERVTGEKQMQGLYSWDQTEWIIPEPIKDGVIPKNSYGNMDCFVPSMVPKGAVHVPLKGTVRICKKLEVDFAEAVTGFEFGNKRAVPVCTGVVVAKENEKKVREAWKAYNEEQKRKEESKMEKLILDTWKKFVIGLRIRERVAAQYGGQLSLDDKPTGLHEDDPIDIGTDDEEDRDGTIPKSEPGGFLPQVHEDEDMGGGFLLPHEDDMSDNGELLLDDGNSKPAELANPFSPAIVHTIPSSAGSGDDEEFNKEVAMVKGSKMVKPDAKSGKTAPVTTKSSVPKNLKLGTSKPSSKVARSSNGGNKSGYDSRSDSDATSEAASLASDSRASSNGSHYDSDAYVSRTKSQRRRIGSKSMQQSTPVTRKKQQTNVSSTLSSVTSKTRSAKRRGHDIPVAAAGTTSTPRRTRRKATTLTSPYFESPK